MLTKSLRLIVVSILISVSGYAQSPCVGSQSMTASPAPAGNNTYVVGTTVTFCYTLSNYAQTNADWIAGFAITLGPGWDPNSLAPLTPPTSCDGQGTWDWYTSCTGTASGITWGPGFYYDTPAGSPNFSADGIPGNNFGDNCQNASWTFCFSVTVGPCAASSNAPLNVGIQALSDYQAGSWGNDACFDPPFTAPAQWPNGTPSAQCNCVLIVPNITINDVSCAGLSNGSITVFPQGVAPYSYQWSNGATSQTISNLPAGIYTVTVTDSTQCTKTVTIPVSAPQPITLNETITDNTCDNASGSISLNPSGGGTGTYTYQWSNGSNASTISNLAGGAYTVTVTSPNGCTQSGVFNITTQIPLSASTNGNQTACGGDPVNIVATASGGNTPYTYNWSNGFSGSSQTVNPSITTVYTVSVIDSLGCTSTASLTVDVFPYPVLAISSDTTVCNAGSAQLSASGASSYSWSPSTGLSDPNVSNPTANPASTTTYFITGYNGTCATTDSVTVVVLPAIVLNEVVVGNICDNSSGSISVSPTGGQPGSTYGYLWSNGSTSSSINGLSGGSYSVTVTDAVGCTQVGTFSVNTVVPVTAISGGNQNSCEGDPVVISASATGGTAPYSYAWSNSIIGGNQTVNPTTTTTYTATATDASGCTSSVDIIVNVTPYPNLQVSDNDTICYQSSAALSVVGASTYSWSPSTGLNNTTSSNPTASPLSTTTYIVTGFNGSCSSTDSVTINVLSQIQPSFTPDTLQGFPPLTVNFSNTSTGAQSYNWDFGDGGTSTTENPTHIYTNNGSYTVLLTATNELGCSDTLSFSFIVVDAFSSLLIPNIFTPNGDGLNDLFLFDEVGIVQLSCSILNRWGNEIYTWDKLEGSWNGKSQDGAELPSGSYVYVVKAVGIEGKTYDLRGFFQLVRESK
ncbi:MAG: gliding motility-associated C-terminal domain-containing protein [Bacteroidota bacterium]|jgi:gliding motility-associated-like protein